MQDQGLESKQILFFDGVCGLCNTAVDWFLRHDRGLRFMYSPLQGETAKALLNASDCLNLESIVYFDRGQTYRRSQAIALILRNLGGVWKWLGYLILLCPRVLSDFVYNAIAKYRYRIFGRKNVCRIPSREERARFLP